MMKSLWESLRALSTLLFLKQTSFAAAGFDSYEHRALPLQLHGGAARREPEKEEQGEEEYMHDV